MNGPKQRVSGQFASLALLYYGRGSTVNYPHAVSNDNYHVLRSNSVLGVYQVRTYGKELLRINSIVRLVQFKGVHSLREGTIRRPREILYAVR